MGGAHSWPYFAIAFGFGCLLGSIPFGLLLTRLAGLGDVRSIGSGNIGATNVLRTGNRWLAAATLLLDGGKGGAAALLAGLYYGPDMAVTAAAAAMIGHMFPLWLKFRGGKGVATAFGILLAMAWPVRLARFALWLVMAILLRYSPLSSITAAATNVTANVIASGDTFVIEILHSSRETLTFDSDTGNLVSLLNLTNTGDDVYSANFGGAADGGDDLSAVVNGRTITGLSLTGAEGLQVYYNGTGDLDSVQLDFTTGFGERLFYAIDAMLTPLTGLMDTNVASLTNQNQARQDRVDDMVARLELTRASLLQRFINMEVALARAKSLRDTLTQTFDAMFASK